jgi:hypothetical protein
MARIKNLNQTIIRFSSQYSNFPPFHYSMGYLTADTTPLSEL